MCCSILLALATAFVSSCGVENFLVNYFDSLIFGLSDCENPDNDQQRHVFEIFHVTYENEGTYRCYRSWPEVNISVINIWDYPIISDNETTGVNNETIYVTTAEGNDAVELTCKFSYRRTFHSDKRKLTLLWEDETGTKLPAIVEEFWEGSPIIMDEITSKLKPTAVRQYNNSHFTCKAALIDDRWLDVHNGTQLESKIHLIINRNVDPFIHIRSHIVEIIGFVQYLLKMIVITSTASFQLS